MGQSELVIIKKCDVSDDAKAVCKNSKFIGVIEVSVDIHLFCLPTGSCLWGHKPISHFVRIDIRFVLIENFQFFDRGIQSFGIVFSHIKFNAGSIKGKDISKRSIAELTKRFRFSCVWNCWSRYLYFTIWREKIYINQVEKTSKINGFRYLSNA